MARRGARISTVLLGTVAVVWVIAWSAPVLAQEFVLPRDPDRQDDLEARARALLNADLRLGPFFFQPQLGFGSGWRSVPEERSAGDPRRLRSDYTVVASPLLRIALPMGDTHQVSVNGGVDYIWFATLEDQRTFNKTVQAQYEYSGNRFSSTISDTYRDSVDDFVSRLESNEELGLTSPEIDERTRSKTNSVAGTLTWNLADRSFIDALATRNSVTYNSERFSEALDREETIFGAGIGYRLSPQISLSLNYRLQEDDYRAVDNVRNARSDEIAMQFDYNTDDRPGLGLRVGYKELEPEVPGALGFAGLVGQVSVSLNPGGFLSVDLSASRNTFPSVWFDSIYAILGSARAAVLFAVADGLLVGGDVSSFNYDYPTEETAELLNGDVLTAQRRDRGWSYGGRARWAVTSSNAVDVRIGYFDRRSNFDTESLEGFTVTTGYTFVY